MNRRQWPSISEILTKNQTFSCKQMYISTFIGSFSKFKNFADSKNVCVLHTRVTKLGLETRKSPSPSPKVGDKVGTGKGFLETLGKIRGLGDLNFWGFLGTNSPKFLMFEVGTRAIILGMIWESLFFSPKLEKCHCVFHYLLFAPYTFLTLKDTLFSLL